MTEPADPGTTSADADTPGSVTVVGTAHVSAESAERVEETIRERRPDVVAVELDEGRYRQMQGETPDDIEAKDLLSGNTVFQFLAYWMLSYVQTQMGERFDIEPGADMRAAIDTAEELDLGLALVDRDIQVTMQRFWTRLSLGEKLKLVGGLAVGVTDPLTLGIAAGAGIGAVLGALFGNFAASAVGLGGLVTLGVTSAAALQALGGLVAGALVGLLAGLFLLPSLRPPGPLAGWLDGFTFRIALGTAAGLVAGVALALAAPVGPLGSGSFLGVGETALRLLTGAAVGGGVGLAVGAVIGLVLDATVEDVEDIDDDFDIEDLTEGDVVTAMMEEFRKFSPRGAEALIDERDAFIAHKLHALRAQGHDVVAVVGAGHRAGIERYLEHPTELPAIESISGTASGRRFSIGKAVGYLFTVGFAAFFFLLLMAGVRDAFLLKLFAAWFLINGVFAFGMARLAGARWSSAGVGGVVAWLTSINPMLAPGWFTGYVELRHRPVNVSDIQRLNAILDDTETPIPELLEEMFAVPLFRLIMIVALTNVGSIIASFLFVTVVVPHMAPEIGGVSGIMNELVTGARNSARLLAELVT